MSPRLPGSFNKDSVLNPKIQISTVVLSQDYQKIQKISKKNNQSISKTIKNWIQSDLNNIRKKEGNYMNLPLYLSVIPYVERCIQDDKGIKVISVNRNDINLMTPENDAKSAVLAKEIVYRYNSWGSIEEQIKKALEDKKPYKVRAIIENNKLVIKIK